ncbi:MAG TPA: hypothetical protein PL131_13620 [Methylotenera sp.]|nr:hypothetical protein [Methylotenera sp.]HPN02047.1 hypothetical protein [Methylotenera sp.]
MKLLHFLSVLLVCSVMSLQVVAADSQAIALAKIVSVQMQEIGYQVGDVAQQTITISTPNGYVIDEASLPNIGKSARSIELRNAQWSSQNVSDETVHTLILDWQIFRVMQETRAYPLKPLILQFIMNNKKIAVYVKPNQMFVASILPTSMKKASTEINDAQFNPKSDVLPKARDTQTLIKTLIMAVLGFFLSSLYFAWRFDWLPAKLTALFSAPLPFRSAYRNIQALQKTSDTSSKLNEAMLALRSACDATAGTALSAERVALMFKSNAQFATKRTEIEKFYNVSERAFFAGDIGNINIQQLKQLCRDLMLIEAK